MSERHAAELAAIVREKDDKLSLVCEEKARLQEELQALRETSEHEMKQAENQYGTAADTLVLAYEKKLLYEARRYQDLEETHLRQVAEFQKKLRDKDACRAEESAKAKEEQLAAVKNLEGGQDALKQYAEYVKTRYEEVMQQQEDEYERKIMELERSKVDGFDKISNRANELRSQKAVLDRKVKNMTEEILQLRFQLAEARQGAQDKDGEISELAREIQRHKDVVTKEASRADAWEQSSRAQGKKIAHLETMKKVREHDLHQIRAELPAREAEAFKTQARVSKLDQELEKGFLELKLKDRAQKEMKSRINQLNGERAKLAEQVKNQASSLTHVAEQLKYLTEQARGQGVLDLPLWVDELNKLFKYLKPALATSSRDIGDLDLNAQDVAEQYKRSLFMEKTMGKLRHNSVTKAKQAKTFEHRMRKENLELTEQLNELRRVLREKDKRITDLKVDLLRSRDQTSLASGTQQTQQDGSVSTNSVGDRGPATRVKSRFLDKDLSWALAPTLTGHGAAPAHAATSLPKRECRTLHAALRMLTFELPPWTLRVLDGENVSRANGRTSERARLGSRAAGCI